MNSEVNSDDEVREWRRGPLASALARVTDQKELMHMTSPKISGVDGRSTRSA